LAANLVKTDVTKISELSTTGVYALLLYVSKEITLIVGKLGTCTFPQGFYTYTGSAHGRGATNLKNRIARHTKKQKKKFWHIDYLLENKNVTINAVVAAETRKKLECSLNCYLKTLPEAKVIMNKFGASDCKSNCQSHLLHFPEFDETSVIQNVTKFLESSEVFSVTVIA
jgi:Uri superfamily endonuclease